MKKYFIFIILVFFIKAKSQNEFITIWKPNNNSVTIPNAPQASNSNQIYFPGIGNNYKIDWEEVGNTNHRGTIENVTSTLGYPVLIDFGTSTSTNPLYKVKVSKGIGNFDRIAFQTLPATMYLYGDTDKIIEVMQWGDTKWKSMQSAFYSCIFMDVTATDVPDLSNVTDLGQMFYNCNNLKGNATFGQWDTSKITSMISMFQGTKFNQNIGNWNTSSVIDMNSMFANCSFNQPIGNWNTSNVTNMSRMFSSTLYFNQPIENWNTSKVTNMSGMFYRSESFNQPLEKWNTSNVTDMSSMFSYSSAFNQPLGNWNTSKVKTIENMFSNSIIFNQNIGNWDTSNVLNMKRLFYYASTFNQPIGNWNTSKVTDMTEMFMWALNFNQPIENWNTSKVERMSGMFYRAKNFNQYIGDWNVSAVYYMDSMFCYASKFNQDIGKWNVSYAGWMSDMFASATAFNQNLGNWNLKNISLGTGMLYNTAITCNNYDKILIGWANNPNTSKNIKLDSRLTYSSDEAVVARTKLINKGWDLKNDIYNPSCSLSTEDLEGNSNFEIYPNPANDFILIKTSGKIKSKIIYSIAGQLLKKENNSNNEINISNLQKGIYLLEVETMKNEKTIKKIIKK